jgi:medium-chain acyl-[acyl-carrier-protein] hydrolase
MEPVRRESFGVKSYNVDFQQKLKPSALLQFFQEIASNHAAALGAGYDALMARELFWALSRLKVEIKRMPGWGEIISIETWPCGTEGLLFRRDFVVSDENKNIIIRAVSGWLLVAVPTLRPQRPNQLDIILPSCQGKKSLPNFPERITGNTDHLVFSKTVAYNEIDQNLHVNNTRYLDWATDCFQFNHFKSHILSEYTLEFLSETHWGDEIELWIGNTGTKYSIQALEPSSGATLFRAFLIWNLLGGQIE